MRSNIRAALRCGVIGKASGVQLRATLPWPGRYISVSHFQPSKACPRVYRSPSPPWTFTRFRCVTTPSALTSPCIELRALHHDRVSALRTEDRSIYILIPIWIFGVLVPRRSPFLATSICNLPLDGFLCGRDDRRVVQHPLRCCRLGALICPEFQHFIWNPHFAILYATLSSS